jgi:hypothetical protein
MDGKAKGQIRSILNTSVGGVLLPYGVFGITLATLFVTPKM